MINSIYFGGDFVAISVNNEPSASILMSSLRSIGYSFEAALADILDNSISAESKNINLFFSLDKDNPYVAISDDGFGMTKGELFSAMRYGAQVNERNAKDLGRFGLGLKSASLSQCKRLSVISSKNGLTSCYIWDIDVIQISNKWQMIELNDQEVTNHNIYSKLPKYSSGTVVIWEKFDIFQKTYNDVVNELKNRMESSANYLSLIFHRFIDSSSSDKITISINNYILKAIDPFLTKHNKTKEKREVFIPLKDYNNIERQISVKPYILPYRKDLDEQDIVKLGGAKQALMEQGFYVYRNKRLILWGTWFHMTTFAELKKHARIRVDIPNSLDDIWGIDVKKQNAVLPALVKNRLKQVVEESLDDSEKVEKHRGRKESGSEISFVWNKMKGRENKVFFEVNQDHILYKELVDTLSSSQQAIFSRLVNEIQTNIPIQDIYIENSLSNIEDEIGEERYAEIKLLANYYLSKDDFYPELSKVERVEKLFHMEPFARKEYNILKKELI